MNSETDAKNKVNWVPVIITGLSLTIFLAIIWGIFFLPVLRRQERFARETSSIHILQEIHRAETSFHQAKARYATINELVAEELLRKSHADGKSIGGYVFTDADVTAETFTIHAVRKSIGDGYRDFSVTETGDIYYAENHNVPAKVLRGQGKRYGYE